ncbi:hydroperoxide isomerase ALOXE3-like [Aquila chrysaetos chrysaetos]|uniref:hydroperoxide isomerase ALOXE3-like n=1 Tax=Aquila chrysaetos chrysaetos TaxID=223781 RepID=UPI001176C433|nr:hydroperoxide isomerase ALOXE3-like [Aquila chrysaetos chrysaetos]
MAIYKVKVATGDILKAGTKNSISITLVGSRGESHQTTIKYWFLPGTEKDLTVRCEQDLGPIVLIRLHKWRLFLEDAWFCKDVRVTAPDGTLYRFPCYQWLEGVITVEFREGSGKKLADDELEILREHRRRELKERQEAYQWKTFAEGWPRCLNVDSVLELDSNVRFSCVRATNFNGLLVFQATSHLLAGFLLRSTSWKSLDEMRSIFSRTKGREIVPEYVAAHWREDDFFGYQFLNGNNPIVIRQCAALPAKFPVTPQMVADFLGGGTDLDKEMREGRIFIVDYDVLDDIPAGTIHGRQQYIAAPLCLLHQGADGLLRPIAIQLSQTPGPTSPVFLPSDAEWDWLLAKTWVRNADFYSHQLLTHLLRTHLFGEVFAVATLRQLPSCHPIFKLLIPHFHFTLHINTLARSVLINPGGIIDKSSGATYEGLLLLVRRGLEKVTYASLCLPDDIRQRGMTQIPNYRYRDDGMILWEAIRSFVSAIVDFYYKEDAAVREDAELQAWAMEIFVNGFLSRTSSGIPSSLRTVAELGKFLTMVVFTCSVQHAAVNNGQYDLGAFVPNAPSSMRHPPPTAKGKTFLQHFLDTLPEVDTTANILVALILLSSRLDDTRLLGQYPEERFTEAEPRRIIRTFRGELEEIRDLLEERNHVATLRYNYLNPLETENSISI